MHALLEIFLISLNLDNMLLHNMHDNWLHFGVFQIIESCIGCMVQDSNVKLQKLCASSGNEACINCFCRPMWCLECMGKWFASRQDQHSPGDWMSCTSPCPTCRAKFCVLDVSLLA